MATCQTKQITSSAPYVRLTVSVSSNTVNQAVISYSLDYIADYEARVVVAKPYIVNIGGTQVASGTFDINGKTGTRNICYGTKPVTKTKSTQAIACSCSFTFNLTWSGNYVGTESASTTISVDPITKYAITYNANGGTGAPSAQSKWYGETLSLSSTRPTRTGYTFQGWIATNGSTYQPGASYTANSGSTMTAIWKADTYTITYNANGGVDAPAAQTKTYGVNLTLSTSKPTRKKYTFKGWATIATGDVYYQPGETYQRNAALTLYAVWELSYVPPQIYNVDVAWGSNSQMGDDGITKQRPIVRFDWKTTNPSPSFTFDFYSADGSKIFSTTLRTSSGATHNDNGPASMPNDVFLNSDESYTIKITGTDGTDDDESTIVTAILTGNVYPIDVLAECKGISFGGPASLEDTAHFQWAAKFDKPVSGKVYGLDTIPRIPNTDDLNNYRDPGCYGIYSDADAKVIGNAPCELAGRLIVTAATGEGVRSAGWSYVRQTFIPRMADLPTYERSISRNDTQIWTYSEWYATTLTKAESQMIHSKSALTTGLTGDFYMGMANTYLPVTLNSTISSYGDAVYRSGSSIVIGENIGTVKISGQLWIKCPDSTSGTPGKAGNRNAKITLNRPELQYNIAWSCAYANVGENVIISFPPIIRKVQAGDEIRVYLHTVDMNDKVVAGSSSNGYQTYLTVETL